MLKKHCQRVNHKSNPFLVPVEKIVEKPLNKDYELKQEIGRGGYGVCRIVRVPGTHKFFVAKIIKGIEKKNDEEMNHLFNEIHLQVNLKHKNIVNLEKVN